MIEWSRFLLSVLVLHSIAEASVQLLANNLQTCTELCTGCGGVATFENERCECNISDGNQEGVECLAHIKKQLEDLELPLPEDATEEERSTRCALRSRRLKTHDADRVVRYFITGGPVVGHSHFVAASNPVYNTESDSTRANTPADIVGGKNPTSDTVSAPITEQKPNIPNFYNPIIGTIHTPVYMMPPMPATNLYPQFSNGAYSPVATPINLTPRYHMPQTNSFVGSILQPHLHPLTSVSQAIERTANLPIQGLVGAQSILNNLLTHGLTYPPPIHYYDNARYNKDAEVTSSSATDNAYSTEPKPKPNYKNSQTAESQLTSASEDAIVGDILNIGKYSGKQKSVGPGEQSARVVAEPTREQETFPYPSQQYVPHQSPLLSLLNPHSHGYILQLVPHLTHFLPSNTIGPPQLPTQPNYLPRNIPKNSDANSEVSVKQTKDIDNHCDPEANGIKGKQNEEIGGNQKTEKTPPGISRNISKKSIKQNRLDKSSLKRPREAEYDVSVEEIEDTKVRI